MSVLCLIRIYFQPAASLVPASPLPALQSLAAQRNKERRETGKGDEGRRSLLDSRGLPGTKRREVSSGLIPPEGVASGAAGLLGLLKEAAWISRGPGRDG